MGKTRQIEGVSQRVTDFVTQQKRLLLEAQTADSIYLLCPRNDTEVEEIRYGAYEWRRKKYPKEEKKAKSPTYDPLLSTQYVRRLLYNLLIKPQMQQSVVNYYGWKEWSEDPWGSYPKFCEWVNSINDNEMAVWAVNETASGRIYLVHTILDGLGQLDFSNMPAEDVLPLVGYGAACFLHVKSYTGWEGFLNDYPKPIPTRLINKIISRVYPFDFKLPYSDMVFPLPEKPDGSLDVPEKVHADPFEDIEDVLAIGTENYGPFTAYTNLISGIYLWHFALDGAREKAKGHPELEAFLDYHVATDTKIVELCRKLAPKDYQFLNQTQSWQKIEQIFKPSLRGMAWQYRGVYPDVSAHKDILNLKERDVAAQYSLLNVVNEWKSKAYAASIKGLKSQLGGSLYIAVKNDFNDATRQNKSPGDKMAEILMGKSAAETEAEPESQEEQAATTISDIEKQAALKQLNYELGLQSKSAYGEDPAIAMEKEESHVTLRSHRLDLEKLSPSERTAVLEYFEVFQEDTTYGSKQGFSVKQALGKDYEKRKRAFSRAKRKLKKP